MKNYQSNRVSNTTSDYLKHRHFQEFSTIKTENGDDDDIQISQEVRAGLIGLISPSSPNSFIFSTTSSQYTFIEQQYIRLKSWMTEASEPCRTELSQVLFPLFVHLFLELLTGAGKPAAKIFFNRHHQVFRVNRDYEQTLRQVLNAASEASTSPVIQILKTGKYLVRLSELTLNYFLRYLQTSGNPTLLQIFNNFIEVELSELSGNPSFSIFKRSDQDSMEENFPQEVDDEFDCSEEELYQIKNIISNVQRLKPLMPSLCVYSVYNAFSGLSCAKVNTDSALLACGFEDSVVKLWRLTPLLQSRSSEAKTNETVLFCDMSRVEEVSDSFHFEKEEEEETKISGGRHISGGELCTLRGHRGPVFDIAFSHCSSYLFSVGEDAGMRLWDLNEQKAIAVYQGHQYPVWCIDVSPQTLYIATGSYDEAVRIWATDCAYPLRTLVGHSGSVDCVGFHPNCNYVASGSNDRSIRLWQICDGNVVRILLHHSSPVKAVSFSPNGKFLASGSERGEIIVWDLAGGKVLCHLGASVSFEGVSSMPVSSPSTCTEPIASLGWSKDSRILFSASSDGYVKGHHFDHTASGAELFEAGSVFCGSTSNAVTLLHASYNTHNYLSAVVAVHGER